MKRLCAVILGLALSGCASAQPIAVPSAVKPAAASGLGTTTVARGAWSVDVPSSWFISDALKRDGDMTQVLEARSPYKVGRTPIRFSISKVAFQGTDLEFATVSCAAFDQMTAPGTVVDQASKLIDLSGHPACLAMMMTNEAMGITVVSVSAGQDGYVMVCGGDTQDGVKKVVEECQPIIKSFRLN